MFINGVDVNANVYKVPEFCNISPVTMDVGGVSSFSTLPVYCTPIFFKLIQNQQLI